MLVCVRFGNPWICMLPADVSFRVQRLFVLLRLDLLLNISQRWDIDSWRYETIILINSIQPVLLFLLSCFFISKSLRVCSLVSYCVYQNKTDGKHAMWIDFIDCSEGYSQQSRQSTWTETVLADECVDQTAWFDLDAPGGEVTTGGQSTRSWYLLEYESDFFLFFPLWIDWKCNGNDCRSPWFSCINKSSLSSSREYWWNSSSCTRSTQR